MITTAANVNDVTQALALVDGVPPVAGRVGHPRKRPDALLGDKGYDSNPNRRELGVSGHPGAVHPIAVIAALAADALVFGDRSALGLRYG